MLKRPILWVPMLAFVALVALLAGGLLRPADDSIPSAMIGRPLPEFALASIVPGKPGLARSDFVQGQPRLLNIFASWCAPCIVEAPVLMQLKQAGVPIDGIAVRDTGPALADFLGRNGDPFTRIGNDSASAVQIAIGSSGVPESFVIDGRGRIVHQHIGVIKPADIPVIIAAVQGAR